ncbi:MAG: hypothetical protein ABJO86_19170 [Lentilitoribacter sp.]
MKIFAKSYSQKWTNVQISNPDHSEGGSEGRVYFSDDGLSCVKILKKSARDKRKIDKLKLMLDPKFDKLRNLSVNGSTVCWPISTAHEAKDDNPIGYIMPLIKESVPLDSIFAKSNATAKLAELDDRIFIAGLLSLLVFRLHTAGAIVGDFNPANIRLQKPTKKSAWNVHIIDTDSFQLTDRRRTLTSDIGRDLYSSPRLLEQQKSSKSANYGWAGLKRKKEDDEYALAILIFQILLLIHPMKIKGKSISKNMGNKVFAYTGTKSKLPTNAPLSKFEALPQIIQKMFSDTFENVTTYRARDWVHAINDLEKEPVITKLRKEFQEFSSPWSDPNKTTSKNEPKVTIETSPDYNPTTTPFSKTISQPTPVKDSLISTIGKFIYKSLGVLLIIYIIYFILSAIF